MARHNAKYYMLYTHSPSLPENNFIIKAKTVAIALSVHAKSHPVFLAAFSKREGKPLSQFTL